MKIAQVNFSDSRGGAARAAYRIHKAVRKCGADSVLYVNEKITDDWSVIGPSNIYFQLLVQVKRLAGRIVTKFQRTNNHILHTPAIFPTLWASVLNKPDSSIIHLHWVASEMLSVRSIGKISKPTVWTLHDMWAFCGAEHYAYDQRYIYGYGNTNRPNHEQGLDLNRWVWRRKLRHWKNPITIVSPSRWLAKCARRSLLLKENDIYVIPNAIDTDIWRPYDKHIARQLLKLPEDKYLVLFAADGGGRDPRKGFDLLKSALKHLIQNVNGIEKRLELVVFGQSAPKQEDRLGININYLGRLTDDLTMMLAYNAADLMVIPSRMDNLPNTGLESLACGTPIVAFDVCGMPDIVVHEETGYLAEAFDCEKLAEGIDWILSDNDRRDRVSHGARNFAVENFSYDIVGRKYLNVYEKINDM